MTLNLSFSPPVYCLNFIISNLFSIAGGDTIEKEARWIWYFSGQGDAKCTLSLWSSFQSLGLLASLISLFRHLDIHRFYMRELMCTCEIDFWWKQYIYYIILYLVQAWSRFGFNSQELDMPLVYHISIVIHIKLLSKARPFTFNLDDWFINWD